MQNGDAEAEPFAFGAPIKSIAIIGAGYSAVSAPVANDRIVWNSTSESRPCGGLHVDNDI